MSSGKLVIIGGGNMGSSFARGALASRLYSPIDVFIIDHREQRAKELSDLLGVTTFSQLSDINVSDDFVPHLFLLAIKPHDFAAVALELRNVCKGQDTVLSRMAGVPCFQIAGSLNWPRVARCMPNLPVEVQKGVIGVVYELSLTLRDKEAINKFLSTLGLVIECETEEQIDAITALSGSGPGYICFLLEKLIETAMTLGFDESTATSILVQTMYGTTSLLKSSQFPPSLLRSQVTSHRGTTAAALEVLEQSQIADDLSIAINAAFQRARELSQTVPGDS